MNMKIKHFNNIKTISKLKIKINNCLNNSKSIFYWLMTHNTI